MRSLRRPVKKFVAIGEYDEREPGMFFITEEN
jgi:hypothetical protein